MKKTKILSENQRDFNKFVLKKYLRHFRSQEEVAMKYGVSQQTLSKSLRTGRVPLWILEDLCLMFDLKRYQLRPDIYEKNE